MIKYFLFVCGGVMVVALLTSCSVEEFGQAGYQSAKGWCDKTQDHCSVNHD